MGLPQDTQRTFSKLPESRKMRQGSRFPHHCLERMNTGDGLGAGRATVEHQDHSRLKDRTQLICLPTLPYVAPIGTGPFVAPVQGANCASLEVIYLPSLCFRVIHKSLNPVLL
jgi:hypothetical protein